uniref:L-fucose dehydrogenase n=1 Tax=Candidatus Kentrum sp. FW TaxID=2126338 RepID=A0A450RYX9_9GAMM|nr:MAG: L-fucose dehydrogenase [Candidatus Kentron sp. FW]VFJ57848.1 MAG: L-fucose dehydrogenase [Candidatus Kentron sp. FW]
MNISSKVALVGQGKTSGYIAAKGAILSLTREWAVEGLDHGVRVNAILPAEVWTEMYDEWLNKFDNPTELKVHMESKVPLGKRMTTPEEIAKTVLYLASHMSSHTTGEFLHPDGGYVHVR